MNTKTLGFTLVELLVVVIVVGILAAIAVPKYIDLTSNARTAATFGVAASLASANAVNYVTRKVNATNGIPVANCTDVGSALNGGVPTGYTITPTPVTVDTSVSCTLIGLKATTANFVATGIA